MYGVGGVFWFGSICLGVGAVDCDSPVIDGNREEEEEEPYL